MMKKLFSTMLVLAILASSAFAAEWKVDKTHSSISFKVRHMVVSKVKGGFDDFSGTIKFDGKDLNAASVEVTIDAASVDTENESRDDHLKSPDFFDVANNPSITFKSTKVVADGDNFKLTGDMMMKGVTKEVVFDVEFSGIMTDAKGNSKAGFSASATINRQDFNVSFSKVLDNGGLAVGNDVEVDLEFELNKVIPESDKK